MNTGMIPVRYAKALLEFAYEKKCAEQVYAEMSAVAGSFEREHALHRVLDNPVLPVDKKTELIRTAGGGRTSEVFDRFVWIASETNGKVELKTSVKPELLGGFVFEMDSERLDASIATQLRNIKKQFVEKNKRIV